MQRPNIYSVVDSYNKPLNIAAGDYEKDGLWHCGKCNCPKQTIVDGRVRSCICKCDEDAAEKERQAARAYRIEKMREQYLPNAAMRTKTFKNAEETDVICKARRYVDKWDKLKVDNVGLVFWGNTGTGKTFAALCIANALIDREIPVKYITAIDLLSDLMDKGTNRREYIKKMCDYPLLIIDDLGAERETPFNREQLCSIIDARIESGRPLIVTTNYTIQQMDNTEDRMMDRLRAACVRVSVAGESRRKAEGADKTAIMRKLLKE